MDGKELRQAAGADELGQPGTASLGGTNRTAQQRLPAFEGKL